MKFVRESREAAAKAVSERIIGELSVGQRVLWLVCGGSNIATEVDIMNQVQESGQNVDALTILPMDERYGEPGHGESNYRQLKDAGFNPGRAGWYDVLEKSLPLSDTVEYYTHLAENAFAMANTVIGVFGLGEDGHTAGVKPDSPAVQEMAATVVGYHDTSGNLVRMTLTPSELRKVNVAYVLAYGEAKSEALERLQREDEPLEKLPAKLLYDIHEVYVYNDQIGTRGEV
jgi:6-phosphogluconolactonase/glucosamine-6-phosphate isomerase/deaminase